MQITQATVICKPTYDEVILHTTLPSPNVYREEPLRVKFEVTQGNGETYVRENFGITPNIYVIPLK
jgi:hypothetical protein